MFIVTAKLTRKTRLLLLGLFLLLIVLLGILIFSSGAEVEDAFSLSAKVSSNEERVAYLSSFGWEVEEQPIDEKEILIPQDFSGVYEEYNTIQKAQGFDLTLYKGFDAVRYTYKVLNYPTGDDTVVADLIVYKDEVIAGDIQSTAMDGFMEGLHFPGSENSDPETTTEGETVME